MQKKLSALWIVGWFPSKANPYAGNFIERHALACSSKIDITLVHAATYFVGQDKNMPLTKNYPFQLIWISVPQFQSSVLKLVNLIIYYCYFYLQVLKKLKLSYQFDIIHVHAADKCGILATWIKQKLKIKKMVLTEHWAIYNSPVPDHFLTRNSWFQFAMKQTWKHTDYTAQVSLPLHKEMQSLLGKTIPMVEFPNVVPADFFVPIEKAKYEKFNFVHVSNFENRKNIALIFAAFAKLYTEDNAISIEFVGADKSTKEFYQKQFTAQMPAELPANDNLFVWEIHEKESPSKINEIFRKSHCLVMASSSENAPCVIAEAHCSGLPVLSSNVGGISDMVNDSNGVLFELEINEKSWSAYNNHNIETLYQSMKIMKQNVLNEKYKNIEIAAQEKYSASSISDKLNQLYLSII
jgi:glycosyltransferase involved in cell wall biosynthesis